MYRVANNPKNLDNAGVRAGFLEHGNRQFKRRFTSSTGEENEIWAHVDESGKLRSGGINGEISGRPVTPK
jgi:hypothetical protein